MERNELGRAKKTFCVISSDSASIINPLPGYGQWRMKTEKPNMSAAVNCKLRRLSVTLYYL
jgi:hypothetical protein